MERRGQEPIRVLLVDDHAIVRKGFRLILSQDPGIQVVGEASNGREAVEWACRLRPHLDSDGYRHAAL